MSLYVNIEKSLGNFKLRTNFEMGNETMALLGASGCGKSMTLKCIAGIEKPDRGRIVLDGVTLFDSKKKINLSPQQRHVGLMFQNYALFPNMTVLENISAGARREKDRENRKENVERIMSAFELTKFSSQYPHELSGGQQQRVALARILVSAPKIILLDEPFSALDSHLRFRLEQEVRQVIHSFGKSVLFVSHDRDEVYRIADSIAIMNEGEIETYGDKMEIFVNPKTRISAVLTGCKNISAIKKLSEHRIYATDWGIELTLNRPIGAASYAGIRMHHLKIGTGENTVLCHVEEEIENPFSYTIMLRPVNGECRLPIGLETDKETWKVRMNKNLSISLPPESLILLE